MSRLTTSARNRIVAAVLLHRFADAVEALTADRAAFAEAVYNDVYRKTDREKMAALPAGWLPEEMDIGVKFGEAERSYENLNFNGTFYGDVSVARKKSDRPEPVKRRMQHRHALGCVKVYEGAHPLSKRFENLKSRKDDLDAQYRLAKKQTEAAIASASTINRLVEMWPEIEPFARQFENVPVKLPALPTRDLNAMLGLPVAA